MIKKLIETGKGEIFSMGGMVLATENLGSFSKIYTTFIKTKKIFNSYGIESKRIIPRGHGVIEPI